MHFVTSIHQRNIKVRLISFNLLIGSSSKSKLVRFFENNLRKFVNIFVPLFIIGFFLTKAIHPDENGREIYESINDCFSFCIFIFTNLYVHSKLIEY